jgi:hypothetical protein
MRLCEAKFRIEALTNTPIARLYTKNGSLQSVRIFSRLVEVGVMSITANRQGRTLNWLVRQSEPLHGVAGDCNREESAWCTA